MVKENIQSKSFPKRVLKSFTQMFTGNVIMTLSGFITGYFFALSLGPEIYGTWQTAYVVVSYAALASMAIPFVMRRDYIQLRADGKPDEAQKLVDVVFTYSFYSGLIIALIIFIASFFLAGNIVFKHALYTVAVYYLLTIIIGFGDIMSKGLNKYGQITWQKTISGAGMILFIPLVYLYGYKMLFAGFIITNAATALYFYYNRPSPYRLFWDWQIFYKLVKTSFPLFLVMISGIVFSTIDRIIIASYLSFTDVGLYSLSNFISNPIRLMVSSLSIVLFTQLNERYGSKTDNHIIYKHALLPQDFFSRILPLVMGAGLLALPDLVAVFLPKYTNGIEAAQINIFSIFFFTQATYSANGLFILDKQKYTAITSALSGTIKVVISLVLIYMGFGIAGVATASVIAYFIYNHAMLAIIFKHMGKTLIEYIKYCAGKLLLTVVILVYIILYEYFGDNIENVLPNRWLRLSFAELGLIAVCIPAAIQSVKSVRSYLSKK